jgi:Myb-like DNA-binding domain
VARAELATKKTCPYQQRTTMYQEPERALASMATTSQYPGSVLSPFWVLAPLCNTTYLSNTGLYSPTGRTPLLGSALPTYTLQHAHSHTQQDGELPLQGHQYSEASTARTLPPHAHVWIGPMLSSAEVSAPQQQQVTGMRACAVSSAPSPPSSGGTLTLPSLSWPYIGCSSSGSSLTHMPLAANLPVLPSPVHLVHQQPQDTWWNGYASVPAHHHTDKHEGETPTQRGADTPAMLVATLTNGAGQASVAADHERHVPQCPPTHLPDHAFAMPSSIGAPPSVSCRKRKARNVWTNQEDVVLFRLVHKYGPRQWQRIALKLRKAMPTCNKDGTQCSQHWRRVLAPRLQRNGVKNGHLKATSFKGNQRLAELAGFLTWVDAR